MSTLVSTCPQTGKEVSTGIEIDLNSFSLLPNVPIRFTCSACSNEHRLLAGEGRLREAPPDAAWRGREAFNQSQLCG